MIENSISRFSMVAIMLCADPQLLHKCLDSSTRKKLIEPLALSLTVIKDWQPYLRALTFQRPLTSVPADGTGHTPVVGNTH